VKSRVRTLDQEPVVIRRRAGFRRTVPACKSTCPRSAPLPQTRATPWCPRSRCAGTARR